MPLALTKCPALARSLVLLLGTFVLCASALSQQPAASPDINTYIHQSWDKLSRSMNECASVVDPKLTTTPVIYLPAGEPAPASVGAMQAHCKVDVRHLPRTIHHEGDLAPEQITTPGLLYLPNRYVVPGGRFNEMYGWDTYFILLGELADGRVDLARGTVENFFYEIDHYGSVLNANRTYFLTRSQPPFLSSMVMEVYRALMAKEAGGQGAGGQGTGGKEAESMHESRRWLKSALPYLERDHDLWTAAPHLAGDTGLSRYFDLGHGPVPEMADDSQYYVDVIHWLKAHPAQAPAGYTEPASATGTGRHCSSTSAANCLRTQADGLELTETFFAGDRAMRESGFDTSFRFGPFSGSTEDYAPICLNALLYKYERDLAFITATLGDQGGAVRWSSAAGTRLAKINDLLWDGSAGLYFDLNTKTGKRSQYRFVTAYYALWAGVATPGQAKQLVATLPLFERAGGLQMSTEVSGVQWDAPFGWAPNNWLAVEGLRRYGFNTEAKRISRKFLKTVEQGFATDGTIREKYNMDSASSEVAVAAGYKSNVIGFGWTNGVYLQMQRLLASGDKPFGPTTAP